MQRPTRGEISVAMLSTHKGAVRPMSLGLIHALVFSPLFPSLAPPPRRFLQEGLVLYALSTTGLSVVELWLAMGLEPPAGAEEARLQHPFFFFQRGGDHARVACGLSFWFLLLTGAHLTPL